MKKNRDLNKAVDEAEGVPRRTYWTLEIARCPTFIQRAVARLFFNKEFGKVIKNRHDVESSYKWEIPRPIAIPESPSTRIIREGCTKFCKCGSTMSKSGAMGLFGEYRCHNSACPHSGNELNAS